MPTPYHDAFLQDILAHPEDDAPRLVYADWLDDHGDSARAEFIRVQCHLARLPTTAERRPALESRQRELLEMHGDTWAGPVRELARAWAFHRGFVDDVTLEGRAFLAGARKLFRVAPVRHLHLCWSYVLPYHRANLIPLLAEVKHLARLTTLDLRQGSLGSDGVAALVVSEHLTQLTALDLSHNHVGDRGVRALADAPLLGRLTHLDLSYNDIGSDGVRTLGFRLETLAARGEDLPLRSVDLSGNPLRASGLRALASSAGLRRVARW